jgi:hypothetical protein
MTRQKDAIRKNTKINYEMDTRGEKIKRTSKKNVDRRSTSRYDSKKFRTRSEKWGGMAFGFRKTATAVIKPDRYNLHMTIMGTIYDLCTFITISRQILVTMTTVSHNM